MKRWGPIVGIVAVVAIVVVILVVAGGDDDKKTVEPGTSVATTAVTPTSGAAVAPRTTGSIRWGPSRTTAGDDGDNGRTLYHRPAAPGAARGRRMTSWPSLRTDLRNAGAEWVDEEVVVDGNLVTSRKPDDIPAFSREAIKLFARHPVAG